MKHDFYLMGAFNGEIILAQRIAAASSVGLKPMSTEKTLTKIKCFYACAM